MNTIASGRRGSRLLIASTIGLAAAVVSITSQAQSITGTISFTGGADVNGSLTSGTAYTGFFGSGTGDVPVVQGGSQTGSYASVPNATPVTFYPFVYMSFTAPQSLWSFSYGGDTYSFAATSLVETDVSGYLNLQGSGTLSITGYSDTAATWSYTDTGSGAGPAFNLGASVTATPEPSALSLMAGLGLVALVLRFVVRQKSSPLV